MFWTAHHTGKNQKLREEISISNPGPIVDDIETFEIKTPLDDGGFDFCNDLSACNFGEEGDCVFYWENGWCDCEENIEDCLGECGGDAQIDNCGECNGNNDCLDPSSKYFIYK